MTDRIPLDHLTNDHLDQLYDQLDELRETAATRKRIARRRRQQLDQAEDLLSVAHETSNQSETERAAAVKRAEHAEAAIKRVRDYAADIERSGWTGPAIARRIREALDPKETP